MEGVCLTAGFLVVRIKYVYSFNLAWTIYWNWKGPIPMEQQFRTLLPDKEMSLEGRCTSGCPQ